MPDSPIIQTNLCSATTLISVNPSVCLSRTIPSQNLQVYFTYATQPNHSKKSVYCYNTESVSICLVVCLSAHPSVCLSRTIPSTRTYQSISHATQPNHSKKSVYCYNTESVSICLVVCLSAHPSVCLSRTIPSTRTYQSISHATQPNQSKKSAVLQHSSASVCIWSGIKLEVLNCTNGTLCWPKNWMSSLFLSFWQLYELK